MIFHERLGEEPLTLIEQHLGVLPEAYRRFVGATNGAAPAWPAVHPGFGFIVDQPLFGFARSDRMQDLGFTYAAFRDRLTAEFLPIAYMQGGLLAIRTSGADTGSIWYYDSDDRREHPDLTASGVRDRLLHRCAGDFDTFWDELRPVPAAIRSKAYAAADGTAWPVVLPRMGTSLPAGARGPVVSA